MDAVKRLVRVVRRLAVHELRGFHSLALWVARRRHGLGAGARPAAYTGPQTAMLFGFAFVAVVETVVLALIVPWPLVHSALLFVDLYTVLQILALHAASVTRPHVAGADGSLRVRYGQFLDLRIAAADIDRVRVERRYPEGRTVQVHEDGTLDVAVGSQTTVTVELARPVAFVRPLGLPAEARVVRLHADDPRALVDALTRPAAGPGPLTPERTAPSPAPDPPA
ncbi:membrane protein [Streptomyces alboflavus]|uniref:Membrane protein n=1 Tax=Streptomyces alboflavus TaxID=67267 RepID=A0A1Z1W9N2_9ACTN|nr:membrane protein [Streptomyces alboflavus]